MSFFGNSFFYEQPAMFQQQSMNHHYPSYQPGQFYNNQQQQQQMRPDPLLQNYNISDTQYLEWVVYLLKNKYQISTVCLELDNVLLDIHTGGRWQGSAEELSRHVRPIFRFLIPELFKQTLHICIVTYSGQEQLVRDAIRIAANLCETRTNRLVFQGNTPDFVRQHGLDAIRKSGKELHIESAIRIIEERWRVNYEPPTANVSRAPIYRNNILLVDFDEHSRNIAKAQGHMAFGLTPNMTLADIYSLLYFGGENQGKMVGRRYGR